MECDYSCVVEVLCSEFLSVLGGKKLSCRGTVEGRDSYAKEGGSYVYV